MLFAQGRDLKAQASTIELPEWCESNVALPKIGRVTSFLATIRASKEIQSIIIPCFFLDRLVTYEGDLDQFSKAIVKVREKKEIKVADQDFHASP